MSHGPVIVLLPGLDGTGRLFRRLVGRCPDHLRTLVIPHPDDPGLDYPRLETLVRQQLPEHTPYVIVGESFSGPLAVGLAARPTGDLRGIILAASFVTPPGLRIWRYLPWRLLFRLPVPAMIYRRLLTTADGHLLRDLREAVAAVSPETLAARVRTTLEVDARQDLAAVECPILYLQARRDWVVARRCLRDIMASRQDVTVERLDTRHPLLLLEPEASWESIGRFADRVAGDGREIR